MCFDFTTIVSFWSLGSNSECSGYFIRISPIETSYAFCGIYARFNIPKPLNPNCIERKKIDENIFKKNRMKCEFLNKKNSIKPKIYLFWSCNFVQSVFLKLFFIWFWQFFIFSCWELWKIRSKIESTSACHTKDSISLGDSGLLWFIG